MAGGKTWLVVGLGNPGSKYEQTRHNAGFHVLDALGADLGIAIDRKKFDAIYGRGRHAGCDVILVKPQSFMNRSGIPVQRLSQFFNVEIAGIVVVYDDIDLPYGKLRLRQKGGHGGHNGIRSLIEMLGSRDFSRVRVGIGRPEGERDVASFVLGKFSSSEKKEWDRVVATAVDSVRHIVEDGILAAMNTYNS